MNITNKIKRPSIPLREVVRIGDLCKAQVSSGARTLPFPKKKSDSVQQAATADDILGSPISLKGELELFIKALEQIPEPPSDLVIDDAEALDPMIRLDSYPANPVGMKSTKLLSGSPNGVV